MFLESLVLWITGVINQTNQKLLHVTETQNHSVIKLNAGIHRHLTGLVLGVFVQCRHILWTVLHKVCVRGSVLALIYRKQLLGLAWGILQPHKSSALLSSQGRGLLGNSHSFPFQKDFTSPSPSSRANAPLHALLRD